MLSTAARASVRAARVIRDHACAMRCAGYVGYPPKTWSPPSPDSATVTVLRAKRDSRWVGRIDASPSGSSTRSPSVSTRSSAACGPSTSSWCSVSRIDATRRAYFDSSTDRSSKPSENVLRWLAWRRADNADAPPAWAPAGENPAARRTRGRGLPPREAGRRAEPRRRLHLHRPLGAVVAHVPPTLDARLAARIDQPVPRRKLPDPLHDRAGRRH